MNSLDNTIEDLRRIALTVLSECLQIINTNILELDLVVTRLESLLDAIFLVSQASFISWAQQVTERLQNAVHRLVDLVWNGVEGRRSVGWPKLLVPINSIENLLSMKFT